MSLIDNLQKKPKNARVLILWVASISVMIVIVLIWLFNFSKNTNIKKSQEGLEGTKLPSLFESLGKDISNFKQGLDASVQEIKDQTNELESTSENNLEQNEGQ